ncbi:MAG: ABC-ATPase UvrA, partial [Oligoflexia bacterium]|nr:ABC-ATPase UvrA [Oligoflexia bacterium]
MKVREIIVHNAREHNLKNIHVSIPRNSLTVITGISGSGKSSLAFDTVYAEGQRRYVESLSVYARQFMDLLKKPEVENIEGLSPSVAINQKSVIHSPRSTVGTVTDIYNYLRLLYARVGRPFCYSCGKPVKGSSVDSIAAHYSAVPDGLKLEIMAPVVRGRKGEHQALLEKYRHEGYSKARIDGRVYDLDEQVSVSKSKVHDIDIIVDRLVTGKTAKSRLVNSVTLALKLSGGFVRMELEGGQPSLISERDFCMDCGISFPEIEPRVFSFNSPYGACEVCTGLGYVDEGDTVCPECNGARLSKKSLAVKIDGRSIYDLAVLSVLELRDYLAGPGPRFEGTEKVIFEKITSEIMERLDFIIDVGLGYLSVSRPAYTLSGGESQRIRLATQLGAGLTGVLYVLDEPSIGLHPKDNRKLLDALTRLRDKGNTVIVVEHDEDTIRIADHIIDLGPGAGVHGGAVVASGGINSIMANDASLTGKYLASRLFIKVPSGRKKPSGRFLSVRNAGTNNLKNISVDIPVGLLTCVTGVSGSGKSSLVLDTVFPVIAAYLTEEELPPGLRQVKIVNADSFDEISNIDQSPIGRSPRSNPATYTGFFNHIRVLLSRLPDSRARGYDAGRFSFNVGGGRCEACQGNGVLRIEMKFMPDVFVECDVCKGQKYNRETLEILYKNKNISQILDMTVE